MKKMLLIDGNSMLFRAYYATLYGSRMSTSNGVPTNAVFGFVHMIQKALTLIEPDVVLVAWDSGKPTFRHIEYKAYKGTRKELDQELIVQFPIAREYLDAANLHRYEQDGVEADDIIGTMARSYPDYQIHILSSDRDLLQLIDPTTDVYLMKKGITEIEVMDEAKLKETMNIEPLQIIDLKGLMGDSADNIPGVKGIGEKTALKLLDQYQSVEGVYEHLYEIKGKLKEKLETGREDAFLSKHLATIITDVEMPFTIEELTYEADEEKLQAFFRKYEMNSFLKQLDRPQAEKSTVEMQAVTQLDSSFLKDDVMIWVDMDNESYYEASVYGFGLYDGNRMQYLTLEDAREDSSFLGLLKGNYRKIGYDVKNIYHALSRLEFPFCEFSFDLMIAAFLCDGTLSDFTKLAQKYGFNYVSNDEIYGKKGKPKLADETQRTAYVQAQLNDFYALVNPLKEELEAKEMTALFQDIEMPLTYILYEMEKNGVHTSLAMLEEIAKSTEARINELLDQIYAIAGHEFNANSPKQLAVVLFDEMGLKGGGKKRSTAIDVLEKLVHVHPIIPLLIEQRKYQKIYSTYATGLGRHVLKDGKIHTIFNQCQTQTGRLSSSEPNLQNISVRDEEAKEIRKAFVASDGCVLLSADYSQIELRMLAHMAKEEEMIHAFQNDIDIHTKTAMQIFGVTQKEVTANMRRSAKTVNFGIVYGQSDFGLSEQLGISRKEAKLFIDKYFESYPRIKTFMDETIAYCEANGYVTTLFNRRRYIKEINDKNYMMREFGKRAAMNAPIQGSAADLIKKAMIDVYTKMQEEKMQSKMILQIHDELIFDVKLEEKEKMIQLVEDCMQHAMELSVPLIAEAKTGSSWFEAK